MDKRVALNKSVSYGISDGLLKKKNRISVSAAVLLLIAAALAVMAICIKNDNSHMEKELSELEARLEQNENEIALLEKKTADRLDDELIIKTAEDKYGMVKRNELEAKQIYVAGNDEREIFKAENAGGESYSIFSAIGETLEKLLEYIGR